MAATRRVNVRFLGVLVGALVVLGPSVYFVNAYQVRRNADALKRRASQAFHEERYEEAAKFYYLYLIQRPGDIEARIGRGWALDKKPSRTVDDLRQAFENFQYVLRLEPDHDDIRRRQVDLALATGQLDEAMRHIDQLLKGSHKHDGELEQLLALCYASRGQNDRAVPVYEEAIKDDPYHIASYAQLAKLYLIRLKEPAKANELMERMLAKNGEKWEARLVAAEILRQQGLPNDDEVKKALELAPDKAETILEAATAAHGRHKLDEARDLLERGLKLHPNNAEMYYRLARVEMEAGRTDQAEECLRRGLKQVPERAQTSLLHLLAMVLVQRGDLVKAEKEIENLRNRGAPDVYVNDLKARVHMHKGEWVPASRLLEGIRPLVAQQPDFAFQVEVLLGRCYERRGQLDRALESYEQALRLRPDALAAQKGKAAALLALGRSEEALTAFRQILPKDPAVALVVARLLFDRTVRLEPENRDWKEVEEALTDARRVAPDSTEVAVLQADFLRATGKSKDALALLHKQRDKDPSQPGPWLALIQAAENQGKPAEALALLEEAEKKLGDRVDLRLARARHWLRRGGEAAPGALAKLEQHTAKFSPAEHASLLAGLAEVYLQTGNAKEAKRLWTQLAGMQPKNLHVRLALFELAFLSGSEEELDPLLREIRSLEGEEGTLWRYCQACRIITAARRGKADRDQLTKARALLGTVAAQRPRWGAVALREAELTDLEGNPQGALDLYQRALTLGERNPVSFRRAVYLLYQTRRYPEAENMLAKLREHSPNLPDDLKRLQISILGQLGNHKEAVAEAEKPIKAGSKDPADHLWYAQALAQAGKKEEAEKAYRAALQLPDIDKLPEIWVQFVLFLVQTDQKPKAEGVVHEAEKRVSAERAPFVLAQCYEALNQPGKVEEQYLNALKKNPAHPAVLRNLVNFYERVGQLQRAQPYLRRLLDPQTKATPEDVEMARRALAVALASTGDYQKLQESLALLEHNAKGGTLSLRDLHAKAKIYAKWSNYWREAINLFEQLQAQQGGLALDEQLDLAILYERYGQNEWPKARRIYLNVLATQAENPALIHLCARSLLRHNEPEDVPNWLEKLQQLDGPQSPRVLEIQVRLLKAQGKLEEAAKLLKEYAERPDANLETAAELLEEFGKPAAAEDLYRKLVDKSGRVESTLLLAAFLGRQGRAADIQEALDLCDKAWKTCPAEMVAYVALSVLNRVKSPTEQQCQRVERGLAEALRKSPQSRSLMFYMAGLRSMEHKYDEAEQLYRRIVEQDPRNAVARNNLAWLLAARNGKERAAEALDLINQAIRLVGPTADLLDTRAFIHLNMDNAEDALNDLKKALQEESPKENPSAVMYFHLALAQERLKDPGAAASLKRAQHMRLKVHPLEQPSYDRLVKVLEQQ